MRTTGKNGSEIWVKAMWQLKIVDQNIAPHGIVSVLIKAYLQEALDIIGSVSHLEEIWQQEQETIKVDDVNTKLCHIQPILLQGDWSHRHGGNSRINKMSLL